MEKIMVYDSKKERSVCAGHIVNNVFIRQVDPKKHWLKIVDGYAIQTSALNVLIERKIKDIIFIEPKRLLKCSVDSLFKNGSEVDLGSGLQTAINKKHLTIEDKQQLKSL